MKIKELEVPVPWGHLAVRAWGDEKNDPIIVVHGILDNVGSFDRLIPLLSEHYYYICMDLPGHGKSSHMSEFAMYNTLDNLLAYKALVDYFDRKKYIFLAHSFGGQLSFIFAQIYPEYAVKLIMLDTVYLFPKSTRHLKNDLVTTHSIYFNAMKKLAQNKPPEYTYEEALEKLIVGRRNGDITLEAAEPILKRMMEPLENGKIRFTVDQKVKYFVNPPFDFRYIADFIKKHPVRCPVLILLGAESDAQRIYFKSIIQQLKKYANIRFKIVEGNHHFHNVTPEVAAPLINEFLNKKLSKL